MTIFLHSSLYLAIPMEMTSLRLLMPADMRLSGGLRPSSTHRVQNLHLQAGKYEHRPGVMQSAPKALSISCSTGSP